MQAASVLFAAALFLAFPACVGPTSPAPEPHLSPDARMALAPTPPPALEPTETPTPLPTDTPTPVPTAPKIVSFAADVAPILARCQPCHFPGGKVYEKLPFDRSETVRILGTKLFTRIKDEDQRQVIRTFLAQNP